MHVSAATARGANLMGAAWMVAAMALFAVEDVFLKVAAAALPVGQILILFGLGGAAVFAVVARIRGARLFVAEAAAPAMRVRAVFEIFGRLFYVLALALTPLSATTVILQATPIVVVAGAALFFGETVGWRRWSAIGIGLLGVIVILQPGTAGFSALSILAVLGMLGFAARDLASRAAPAALGTAVLGFYGFLAVAAAGALFSLWDRAPFVWPPAPVAGTMACVVIAGTAAYGCLMRAMRTGDVSAVTPFRYTRLLFGIGFGVALFGEEVTGAMMLGSALIVASGMFILWLGRAA
ncbi:MAG: DMT family transporter [Pseudomonadota bacterium]